MVIIIGLVLSSFLVNAQAQEFTRAFENIINGIGDFLEPLAKAIVGERALANFGSFGNFTPGELLFVVTLLGVMLFSVIWWVLDTASPFKNTPWVVFVVALAVSVISLRMVINSGPEWLNTMLLPYGTMGIVITSLLPLIIFFYFVEEGIGKGHPVMRKGAWIFAAVVFVGLYVTRFEVTQSAWIYGIAAALCIALLLFDQTIQRAWNKVRSKNLLDIHNAKTEIRLTHEIQDLLSKLTSHSTATNLPIYKTLYDDLMTRANGINRKDLMSILPQPT